MHPCLETFDILLLICTSVRDDEAGSGTEGTHPTLASLARTCRAFHEVASDLLWEEQMGVQPLIKCMPPDLWHEERLESGEIQLTLRRPMQLADWQSCRRYRDRVKVLNLPWREIPYPPGMYDEDSVEWYHFPISPELSLAMHASLPEEGIFPNLHTLKLPWTELVQFLCSPAPHLRSLTICVNQYFLPIGPELRLPAMLSFPSYCPNVKNFVVAFEGLGDYPRSAVPVDMACEWAGLTNLLLLLAKFDDLQKLSRRLHNVRQLGFFWEDTIPESPSKPRSLPFLHLRNLKMAMIIREHGGSVGYNILDALEVPELEVLSLFLLRRPTSSGWLLPSLFTSLSSLNPASMRTIHFEELTRSPHNPHNSLRRETMQPLFSCRYITVFRWTCTDGFDLDDGDLGVLAASWPSLRLLDLSAGIDWATPSRLTLHGLVKLVQLCPCLESLGIVIDAADVVLADFAAYTTPNTVFENLNVGNSPITDVEAVGTVLARVIPCVHNITARKSSGLGTEAARFMLRWMEVGQLINPSMLPIENY